MSMSDVQYELMRKLEGEYNLHGMIFVSVQDADSRTVKALEKRDYIEVNPKKAEARITKLGLLAVVTERKERGDAPLEPVVRGSGRTTPPTPPPGSLPTSGEGERPANGGVREKARPYFDGANPQPQPAPAAHPTPGPSPQAERGDCGDCECVPRRVLDLLAARNPKVRDLIEALEMADAIIEELGL